MESLKVLKIVLMDFSMLSIVLTQADPHIKAVTMPEPGLVLTLVQTLPNTQEPLY